MPPMKVRPCVHCGVNVDRVRWAKGKHWCSNCGIARGLKAVALQAVWSSFDLDTQLKIMAPYLVDNPLWTATLDAKSQTEE
jgi:predicted RNA-binding Zn-ribbon protein involved in translation (DUF1610 family)